MNIEIRIMVMFAATFSLVGCETSTGILPIGPDTYTIAVGSELGGSIGAKKQALTEANQFCLQRGQQLMPLQSAGGMTRDAFGDAIGTFDFTFRCLSPGDPGLGRPGMAPVPDVVIQHN